MSNEELWEEAAAESREPSPLLFGALIGLIPSLLLWCAVITSIRLLIR